MKPSFNQDTEYYLDPMKVNSGPEFILLEERIFLYELKFKPLAFTRAVVVCLRMKPTWKRPKLNIKKDKDRIWQIHFCSQDI